MTLNSDFKFPGLNLPGTDPVSRALNWLSQLVGKLLESNYDDLVTHESRIDTHDTQISSNESTLASKNETFRQSSEPPAADSIEGDIWFDTSDDNKPHRYDGSSWTETEFDVASWSKVIDDDTNKPDNNADVTADNNNWSEVNDDDSNKPDNNADVTADNETFSQDSDINALNTTNAPAESGADVTSSNETFSAEADINVLNTTNAPAESGSDVTSSHKCQFPTSRIDIDTPSDVTALSTQTWTDISTITYTVQVSSSVMFCIGSAQLDVTDWSSGTIGCPLRITDGTNVIAYNGDCLAYGDSSEYPNKPWAVSGVTTGISGSTTFHLQAYENSATYDAAARNINFMIQEIET